MASDLERLHSEMRDLSMQLADFAVGDGWGATSLMNEAAQHEMDPPLPPSVELKQRRVLRGHAHKVASLQWSRDSRHVLSIDTEGVLIKWDAMQALKTHVMNTPTMPMMCAWSPDERVVAVGGMGNVVQLFSMDKEEVEEEDDEEEKAILELVGHESFVTCASFRGDGELISGSGDATVRVWDLETGKETRRLDDHHGAVMSVAVGEGAMFLTGSTDVTCGLFDTRQKIANVAVMRGHESDVNGVRWMRGGAAFASASDDSTVRVWDLASRSEMTKCSADRILCGVTSVDFTSSGRGVIAGYDDYTCVVWDAVTGKIVQTLQGHDNRVSHVEVAPDGLAMATASWDTTVGVWA